MTVLDVPSGRSAALPTPGRGDVRLAQLSLNQKTVNSLGVREAVELCVRTGIPAIGVWREPLAELGARRAAGLIRSAGLRVSSLCRGGFLTHASVEGRAEALADNRRAIEEAAELGTRTLVLVVGGLPPGSRDLAGARAQVADGVAVLAPYAQQYGVRLALEPMHPIYCADRGVLSTLDDALDLAELFPPAVVGVVVDTFHVWWDPAVADAIARAGERIAGYQVCDWVLPLPADTLLARGVMGDGHIDFAALTRTVAAAGYTGDVEVEIFNADVWAAPPDEVAATVIRRYVQLVQPSLSLPDPKLNTASAPN
jgi:sugar phosphate isomerase/epimerase